MDSLAYLLPQLARISPACFESPEATGITIQGVGETTRLFLTEGAELRFLRQQIKANSGNKRFNSKKIDQRIPSNNKPEEKISNRFESFPAYR